MSNRSLVELNHDFAHAIKGDPLGFHEALANYLSSGSPRNSEALRRYGVTVFGMRHHSDPYRIQWGGLTREEKDTP